MLPKNRYRHVGIASSVLLPLFAAIACSGADSPPSEVEGVAESTEAIGVSLANGCAVFWDKINYDTPAANDVGEFIELRVVKTAGSTATTLAQCGLTGLVLINGGNCQPYSTIQLGNVTIPNDGLVQICDTTWNAACDVDMGSGWLQNDNEALLFLGPGPTPLLHASWENVGTTKICLPPDAGALPSIVVPTDTNAAPDSVAAWCPGGFQVKPATGAGLGMAYTCGTDAGVDASPDATDGGDATATDGSDATATGGTGGAATGGTGGAATGGTGGAATGGTGGAATGGTGGAATGGAAGTGGASTGGAAGTGGAASGGAAGTGGAATGGGGSGATGGSGTGGSATGGTAAGGAGGKLDAGPGNGGSNDSGDDGGCGCRAPGGSRPTRGSWLALFGTVFLVARRRR